MNDIFDTATLTHLLIIPSILLGFTVHELGHAFMAYYLGDHSQVEKGNLTLNPFKHVSYFGSLAFILTGYFGWPKALQVDVNELRGRYLGLFLVAISGPIASFTLCLCGLLLTMVTTALLITMSGLPANDVLNLLLPFGPNAPTSLNIQALAIAFTGYLFISSFWMTVASLLPLPGFDGFTVVTSLVMWYKEKQQNQQQTISVQPTNRPILLNKKQQRNKVALIHFNVGTEYHDEHQYDDAIARYRQTIKNDEQFGPAYVNMGLAYLAKGKRKEAIQAFRGAIEYADDQKSPVEAWQQLHVLSEVTPTNVEQAKDSMLKLGAQPWKDTIPKPNWFGLGITLLLLSIATIIIYIYLVNGLITLLTT